MPIRSVGVFSKLPATAGTRARSTGTRSTMVAPRNGRRNRPDRRARGSGTWGSAAPRTDGASSGSFGRSFILRPPQGGSEVGGHGVLVAPEHGEATDQQGHRPADRG